MISDILAQHNRRRTFQRWSKSVQKKDEPTLLYSALIKKNIVSEVNSFAFNGNLLHWEHDRNATSIHTFISFFGSCENKYVTINKAATCDASLQVWCNAACVKMQHC